MRFSAGDWQLIITLVNRVNKPIFVIVIFIVVVDYNVMWICDTKVGSGALKVYYTKRHSCCSIYCFRRSRKKLLFKIGHSISQKLRQPATENLIEMDNGWITPVEAGAIWR